MTTHSIRHKNVLRIGIGLCLFVFLFICIRQFYQSAFFHQKRRINILFYSHFPLYLSLERGGDIHYAATFDSDSRTYVPGGYGIYRIGGLGKMIKIEKKPEIIPRTFSRITGSMVDFAFYQSSGEVYYGTKEEFRLPPIHQLFFMSSNARFFDRVFIALVLLGKDEYDFDHIEMKKTKTQDAVLLSDDAFQEKYLGYFYDKSLRSENKTVQILYSKSYQAASTISRIIDGEGMRVSDIDVDSFQQAPASSCEVVESGSSHSKTALRIAAFFSCSLKKGKTRLSDIILLIGKQAERDWE